MNARHVKDLSQGIIYKYRTICLQTHSDVGHESFETLFVKAVSIACYR